MKYLFEHLLLFLTATAEARQHTKGKPAKGCKKEGV